MKELTSEEIEKQIYGEKGLYYRVVTKICEMKKTMTGKEISGITGKKRTYIDSFVRQYWNPNDFESRPKFDTITELAAKLGVE